MGLDTAAVKFLCAAKSMGVDFTDTAMIGRQSLFPSVDALQAVFSILGIPGNADAFLRDNEYGEAFFTLLGAKRIASVDASNYENASHICDMNLPIPADLRERFSVVLDGGTLEHIFNIPQALKNCMEMVKVGGHFIQVNEANNFMGHGFWQLSPELIFRAFAPNNGYRIEIVLLHQVVPGGGWYLVFDPEKVRRRVELCNCLPTYILTIAKRMAIADIFASPPQQSDYVAVWNRNENGHAKPAPKRMRFIPDVVKRVLKSTLRRFLTFAEAPAFHPTCYQRIAEDVLLRGEIKSPN